MEVLDQPPRVRDSGRRRGEGGGGESVLRGMINVMGPVLMYM